MCNCPTDDEMFRSIDRWIDQRRWQLIGVGFGPEALDRPPWTYTIGLAEGFGHPELFLVGACCFECSGHVLNRIAERVAAGERFDVPTGAPLVVGDRGVDIPLHLRAVEGAPLAGDWFAMWHRYYGSKPYAPPPLRVMQVVLPDAEGRFPWEPGCDESVTSVQQVSDQPPAPRPRNRAARRRAARHRR